MLEPCPACKRHVKPTEATCPFCNAARPSRVAPLAAAAALATSLATGCPPPQNPGPQIVIYGAPPQQASPTPAPPKDQGVAPPDSSTKH